MESEVCIVGAGVIGLVLASELSKRGIGTIVYDAKKHIGDDADKASGVLSKSGMDRTGIAYGPAIMNTLNGATLHAVKERINVRAKTTKAYVIDRRMLAEICMKEAEQAGAEIKLGKRLSKEDILLMASGHKVVVGADGAVSLTASAFHFPEIREYVFTYKAEYKDAIITDKNSVSLYFDNSIAKRFFAWAIPYSASKVELGIGISSRSKGNSKAAFDRFVKAPKIAEIIRGGRQVSGHASLIPLHPRKRTASGNALLVGDAAGQVKATTGGGIIFGAACAKVAADSINDHLKKGKSLLSYDFRWRKAYGLDLSVHRALHTYYSSINGRRMDLLFKMIKLFGGEAFFSNYGDMDMPSGTLKNLFFRKGD